MTNSIIILNYNDYKTTIKLLDNIFSYNKLNHIIVVDNNSSDNSYSILLNKYKNIKKIDVIKTDKNKGYAAGNNFGADYAIRNYKPDILFIANPDIMLLENIIENINSTFNSYSDIGILAPKVSKGYNSWKLPNYLITLASMFLYLSKKFGNKVYKNQDEEINYVDVVAGSLFAIRTDVFKKIGGFDERTFLYYEENILAYKLKKAGYKSAILGNSSYDHLHAVSIKKEFKSKMRPFNIIVNSIKVYLKNYLNINIFQLILFEIVYVFAFIERLLYDIVMKIGSKIKK